MRMLHLLWLLQVLVLLSGAKGKLCRLPVDMGLGVGA